MMQPFTTMEISFYQPSTTVTTKRTPVWRPWSKTLLQRMRGSGVSTMKEYLKSAGADKSEVRGIITKFVEKQEISAKRAKTRKT